MQTQGNTTETIVFNHPLTHSLYVSVSDRSAETKNGMCDFIKSSASSAGQALTDVVNLMDSAGGATSLQSVLPIGHH